MNLLELKRQVLFQTGSDADDLGDFQPHLTDYINEAYDRLLMAYKGVHADDDGEYPLLKHDKNQPELPLWAHRAMADFAAWMVYRNGSAQKQNRGFVFRKAFEEAESRLRMQRGGRQLRNIPR